MGIELARTRGKQFHAKCSIGPVLCAVVFLQLYRVGPIQDAISCHIARRGHHTNAVLLADELELAQSRANVIVPKAFI